MSTNFPTAEQLDEIKKELTRLNGIRYEEFFERLRDLLERKKRAKEREIELEKQRQADLIIEEKNLEQNIYRLTIWSESYLLVTSKKHEIKKGDWWYSDGLFTNDSVQNWSRSGRECEKIIAYTRIYGDRDKLKKIPELPSLKLKRESVEDIKEKIKDKAFSYEEFMKALNNKAHINEFFHNSYGTKIVLPKNFKLTKTSKNRWYGNYLY
jgi:hypothetical protein